MPRPRRIQISVEDTPYYHCCSRVVRNFNKTPIVKFGYQYTQGLMRLSTVMEVTVRDRDVMVEPTR